MLRLIVSLVLCVHNDIDSQIGVLIVRIVLLLMCAFMCIFNVLLFMCTACTIL